MHDQEIVYKLSNDNQNKTCYRDKLKCNRFWFEFPAEWRTSLVTERVIGFRSLWIPFTYRTLRFTLKVYTYQEDEQGIALIQTHIIYFNINLRVGQYFEDIIEQMVNRIKEYCEEAGDSIPWKYDDIQLEITTENSTKYGGLVNCFKISQIYNLETYTLNFELIDMNDDAKAIFNCENGHINETPELVCQGIWTRHRILLRSSISVNNCKNYLGQSQKDYKPIKYYTIQCNENRFYIDLIDAHNSTTLVNLPVDDKEDLIVEMVIPHD